MRLSALAEPAGDAHAGLVRGEDFVPKLAGHEADQRAEAWLDELEGAGFLARLGPDFQLAAV